MKRYRVLFIIMFCAFMGMCGSQTIQAQTKNIVLYNGDVGNEQEESYFSAGDNGKFEIAYYDAWQNGEIVCKEFQSEDASVVKVDAEGNYNVLKGGKALVRASAYNAEGTMVFQASFCFLVYADVSGTSLSKTSVNMYNIGGSSDAVMIPLVNAPDLTYYSFQYVSSNSQMYISCELDAARKMITVFSESAGTATLTIYLNGKPLYLNVTAANVTITKTSSVIAKKKKTQLRIKGYPGRVKWKSAKKKVASVSSKGVVKGKKTGNTVVYAKIGERYLGCAVSVVTTKMKKVVSAAKKIAKTCKYSQAKRMQSGYYDCSSLVWKSYRKIGKAIGNKNYAPVAADIGKWCAKQKKMIKGGLSSKNIQKMKLRPGDLMFETGAKNGRYKGIYHVEMFVGYECVGFDGSTLTLGTLWAARPANYYYGCIMGRP